MVAARYDIKIEQGSDFGFSLLVKEEEQPKDLTGFSIRGQLRQMKSSSSVAANFTCEIVNELAGTIGVRLPNSTTARLKPGLYVYDVEIYTTSPDYVIKLLKGKASVEGEVTR